MRDTPYCVYIVTNTPRGVLYVGVTSRLLYRVSQPRLGAHEGFTRKCGLKTLVGFETHGDIREAIHREKLIKRWRRQFKFDLIEAASPEWRDLWPELTGEDLTPLI